VDLEGLGKVVVALDQRVDISRLMSVLEARHIEAGVPGTS